MVDVHELIYIYIYIYIYYHNSESARRPMVGAQPGACPLLSPGSAHTRVRGGDAHTGHLSPTPLGPRTFLLRPTRVPLENAATFLTVHMLRRSTYVVRT
jgi:hypothetical protein